jgi:uncharacterized membrane protein YeaQ/YmgE (transglycosylase-associated protein family)
MTERDHTRGGGLNTGVDAGKGQRVTAIVVGLFCSILVGGLCAWLADSVFSAVPAAIQWLVFAVIGAVIGLCLVTLLTRLRAGRRR